MNDLRRQAQALEEEIAQLKQQWPKHSLPPALLLQLETLEEELAALHAALRAADVADETERSQST